MKRQFTTEEARQIFADAAERQQAARRDTGEQLTLDDLEEAAVASGIDPAFVRAAAENLVRPEHHPEERRIAGLPVNTRQSVVLPFQLGVEEWGQIVVELRSVFKKHGIATEVGLIREWVSDTSDRNLPVRVTLEPEGSETRLTIERSRWQQSTGLGAATASLFLTSLILLVLSFAGPADQIWIPAFMIMIMGVLFGAGAFVGTRIASRRDAERFAEAIRRVRSIGKGAPRGSRTGLEERPPVRPLVELDGGEADPAEQVPSNASRLRRRG